MSIWRERARTAEDLGYAALYVTDHLDSQFGPLVAATVAAEATTTLHVGTLVLNNDLRNPVVLAKEIASLGLAAEGRVELGLGAGWLRSDYEETGVEYDAPGERVARLAESLMIMRTLWSEGEISFEGAHYTVRGARCAPRPPAPPRIIVGGAAKQTLTVAAQNADTVNVSLASGMKGEDVTGNATLDHFDRCVNWIRQAAGSRFDSLELQTLASVMIVNTRRAAVRSATMLGYAGEESLELPSLLIGTEDELCERIVERREKWGFSSIVVPGESMEIFAPVVERLAGS
jgi:probable F420-dependent oxidoreductase